MTQITGSAYTVFVLGLFFGILCILTTVGRFFTRRWQKADFWLDDWFLIPALLSTLTYIGLNIWGVVTDGAEYQPTDPRFSYAALQTFLKSQYLSVPFYLPANGFSKLSLLCLYRRVFIKPGFRRVTTVISIFCVAWMISGFLAGWLYCLPMAHFWNPMMVPGNCFNFDDWFLASSIIELIMDVVIITLPFPLILKLNLSTPRKLGISGIFALGFIVIITGIIRIALLYKPSGSFIDFTKGGLWTIVQLSVGVLCACLPTYRPMMAKITAFAASARDYTARTLMRSRQNSKQPGSSLQSRTGRKTVANTDFQAPERQDDQLHFAKADTLVDQPRSEEEIPMHAIEVTREVEVEVV